MSDVTITPTVSLETYNRMADEVNAGRQLVHYARHYDYCPVKRTMLPELIGESCIDVARRHAKTCNCGLAESVLAAFGEKP